MPDLIREPIGLRVLVRALRPEDSEPFLLWRAAAQGETDTLIEAGEAENRAALWAALLRWREAEQVSKALAAQGWTVTLHGVRAIALARAVETLAPPTEQHGWLMTVASIDLRAVPENPTGDEAALERLLSFLEG